MLIALVNRALLVELAQTRELNPDPAEEAFKITCSEAVNGGTGSTKNHWPLAGPLVSGLGAGFWTGYDSKSSEYNVIEPKLVCALNASIIPKAKQLRNP